MENYVLRQESVYNVLKLYFDKLKFVAADVKDLFERTSELNLESKRYSAALAGLLKYPERYPGLQKLERGVFYFSKNGVGAAPDKIKKTAERQLTANEVGNAVIDLVNKLRKENAELREQIETLKQPRQKTLSFK